MPPEYESLNDALIECVKRAGGSKQVANKLWPAKAVDAAQRHLLACLDESKPERLSPDHLLMLLRLAREVGHHGGMHFIAESLSYAAPQPIEPKDEAADLMRRYIESVAEQKRNAERMEKAVARLNMRAVA